MLFEDLCSFVLHLFYSQGNMVGKCGCIQEPHYFALLKQVCFSFVKQNAFQIVCTKNHQKLPILCPHTDLVLSPLGNFFWFPCRSPFVCLLQVPLLLSPMLAPLSSPRRWRKIRCHSDNGDDHRDEEADDDLEGATLIWWNLHNCSTCLLLHNYTRCVLLFSHICFREPH